MGSQWDQVRRVRGSQWTPMSKLVLTLDRAYDARWLVHGVQPSSEDTCWSGGHIQHSKVWKGGGVNWRKHIERSLKYAEVRQLNSSSFNFLDSVFDDIYHRCSLIVSHALQVLLLLSVVLKVATSCCISLHVSDCLYNFMRYTLLFAHILKHWNSYNIYGDRSIHISSMGTLWPIILWWL